MKLKHKFYLYSVISLLSFTIFTLLVMYVDRKAIGPNDSVVGLASMNGWVHELTGVHFTLYYITDIGSIPAVLMGMSFGFLGLVQWIKRKNMFKVDRELLILGSFYIVVFIVYAAFQFIKVNYRPVLIEGKLEPSYPSSTTVLSLTFMISAFFPVKKYIKNERTRNIINISMNVYMLFLIIGRILSGVHWLSDIIGAILVSICLVLMYKHVTDTLCKEE